VWCIFELHKNTTFVYGYNYVKQVHVYTSQTVGRTEGNNTVNGRNGGK